MPIAIEIVEVLVSERRGVDELIDDVLDGAESIFDRRVAEVAEDGENIVVRRAEAPDTGLPGIDGTTVVDKVIDVTVPSLEPIENKFMALTPGQQLPLNWVSEMGDMLQHINASSPTARLLEHIHIGAPCSL